MTPSFKVLGDTHLGRTFINNVPLHRRGDREEMVWQQFERELDPEGKPCHVHMGDLFDKALVPLETISKAAQLYNEIAWHNPTTTFFILQGNHDASKDLERVSAFRLFQLLVERMPNIAVVTVPRVWENMLFLPYDPVKSAEELMRGVLSYRESHEVAFGHWDVDARSSEFNLVPCDLLAQAGVTRALTGHVHKPDRFTRDGVDVTVVGSMQPYAFGEQINEDLYIDLSLDEALSRDDLKNKVVRVTLKKGETLTETIDCLGLQVRREEEVDEKLDVNLGEFSINKLFEETLKDYPLPQDIEERIRTQWQRVFG
jgi:DNA repair exonuclease SbcCD nuclease subunit